MTEKTEVIKYYSNISKTYNSLRLGNIKNKMISGLQIDWIIKNLEKVNSVCLEVGCGTGRITRNIIERVSVLVASDSSLEMIRINKSTIKLLEQNDRVDYVLCDASHLPFRDECFNSVVGARLFWHIPAYTNALTEALRVVKINNSVLFDFPCLWGPFSLHSKLFRIEHEVLTEFINRETIKLIFKKSKRLIIGGNTSLLLLFAPVKILECTIIRRLICQFEKLEYGLVKDLLFSYYLIKVIK